MQKLALLFMLLLTVSGCAELRTELRGDARDAPWDPRQPQSLFDQMPAWDDSSQRLCCGSKRTCREGQTPRC